MAIDASSVIGIHPGVEGGEKVGMGDFRNGNRYLQCIVDNKGSICYMARWDIEYPTTEMRIIRLLCVNIMVSAITIVYHTK